MIIRSIKITTISQLKLHWQVQLSKAIVLCSTFFSYNRWTFHCICDQLLNRRMVTWKEEKGKTMDPFNDVTQYQQKTPP